MTRFVRTWLSRRPQCSILTYAKAQPTTYWHSETTIVPHLKSHLLNISVSLVWLYHWLLFVHSALSRLCCIHLSKFVIITNNMKLVLWPLMGRLLHLVQRGGDWGAAPVHRRKLPPNSGGAQGPFLPLPSPSLLPFPPSPPFPFPLLRSRPRKSSKGVWGSAVSSPSAEIEFGK